MAWLPSLTFLTVIIQNDGNRRKLRLPASLSM
jgi:hypothetical protein